MTANTVWIVNPYGSLPGESWATYRSTMLAESLAEHGYVVTQFISNFEHRSKAFRTGPDVVDAGERYRIQIVPGSGYESHVSLRRIRHERTFARNLLKAVSGQAPPDFIILAEPALFYYDILLKPLILEGGSILVLDVIDIWPELFELVIPAPLRRFSHVLLAPLYYWRRRLYRYPKAIVSVARDYQELARQLAPQEGVVFDVVYWGYDTRRAAPARTDNQELKDLVASRRGGEILVVYAGTLGENYDIQSILDLADRLPRDLAGKRRLRFVIAGDGPLRDLCRSRASDTLVFLGRLTPSDLAVLYEHSDIALSTYKGESTVAMPIKAFDYIRYGLPVVNSLGRDLGELVRTLGIGVNYTPGSAASLHDAVSYLALNDEVRRRCAANAKALAGEFSSEKQYGKFVSLLQRLKPAPQRVPTTA